jgi:hypothetical protein
MLCGDAPQPDPLIGQAAKANAEVAKEALTWYKDVYANELLPIQKEQAALGRTLVDRFLASQDKQEKFADEQNQYYTDTFRPVERQVARDAMEYDSESNINRRMGIAGANVEQAYSQAAQQNSRNLSRYGLNPNSSAFALTNERLLRDSALAKAGAQTGAAFDAMDRGIALRAGAANFGRNMPNTAASYYGGANAAGGAAMGTQGQALGGAINAGSFAGQGFNTAISGNQSAGNLMLGDFQGRMQGYAAEQQAIGGLFQGLGTFAGMAYTKSSKDYKENKAGIQDGVALKTLERMDVESWKYKDGIEDGDYHVGPYAEDFRRETGIGDGKSIPLQDAVGITMRAVQDLAQEVRGLESVQGKADGGKVHRGHGGVRGPGGPVDDKVPAMLSNGEYVLPADTVKAIGKKKLDQLVKSTHTPASVQRRRAIGG